MIPRNKAIKPVISTVFLWLCVFCSMPSAYAQRESVTPLISAPNGPPPTPVISGPGSAVEVATSAFTTTQTVSGTTFTWSISTASAGTISSSGTTATVHWVSTYSGTINVFCTASNTYGASQPASKSVVVTGITYPLVAGTVSPSTQTINYGATATLNGTASTGGNGSFGYQWESSSSSAGPFSVIINATSASYTTPALTATTYYERITTSGTATATTSVATVTVNPQLTVSTPSPASQTINSGGNVAPISATAGGGNGSYTYQWQSSPDNGGTNNDWVNVPSSNSSGITETLNLNNASVPAFYHIIITSNGSSLTSSSAQVSVIDCYQLNTNPAMASNYILTTTLRTAGIASATDAQLAVMGVCEADQTIQYLDGLGRPLQTVQVKASPLGNDIVQPVAYDQYGRETTKYLPYVAPGTNNGAYRNAAITEQANFYNPAGNGISGSQQGNGIVVNPSPYSQTIFEPSPLNRVIEQGAPGSPWQPIAGSTMGHTNKIIYTTNNSTSFASDSVNGSQVTLYNVTINSDNSRTLNLGGFYSAGTLYLTITQDENWHGGRAGTIEEYKDIEGRIILKRTYNYTGTPATLQMLSTYYVYDNLDNLCYVLPPGANPDNMSMVQVTYDNLCYQYWYDARNRVFRKKLPGKGWEFTVYNALDHATFTQDADQRNPSQGSQVWTFIQYDPLGRVVITGIWNSAGAPGSGPDANITTPYTALFYWLQNWQNSGTQYWVTRDNTRNIGYAAVNPQQTQFLKINYYDDYAFLGQPSPFTTPSGASVMTRGLLTGTKTMVLNTMNNTSPDMLTDAHYYDNLGRETVTYKQHYFGGVLSPYNYDQVNNTYDFANELIGSTRQHFVANTGNTAPTLSVMVANNYIYDHEGRKKQTWEQINGGANVLLVDDEYNEIGQLLTKNLHGTSGGGYLQSVGYTYNERGWMLSNTAQLFQEQLQYNNTSVVDGLTPTQQYNGNIAAADWGTQASPNANSYIYSYDNLNRLLVGKSNAFNIEVASYDAMGNISQLSRTHGFGSTIDNLSYGYTDINGNYGNQLQSIADASPDASGFGMASGTTNYTYDNNGNEVTQTNTANTTNNKSITYNMLNLPQLYTLPTGTVNYIYDADGTKLRKISVINGTTSKEDYINGIQYNTIGAIDFVQTEEGRVLNSDGAYYYEYSLTDHLGNERVTFDTNTGAATTVQTDDYYPFGMEISTGTITSPKNEYLYNKKELQEELGQYDYGARFYDPAVARWTTPDPLAEFHPDINMYNYVLNNPVNLIDPFGLDTVKQTDKDYDKGKVGDQVQGDNNKYYTINQETGAGSTSQETAAPASTDNSSENRAPTFNFDSQANYLDRHSFSHYIPGKDKNGKSICGHCALHVRLSLEAGGLKTNDRPPSTRSAKNYGPYLEIKGYRAVGSDRYMPQKGDVRVWQPYPGGDPNGHIDAWDGNQWVSDFKERPDGPGPGYRKNPNFEIYRRGQ